MRKAFIAPLKYIQCEDALKDLGRYVKVYGDTALVVASKEDFERVNKQIAYAAKEFGVKFITTDFGGECSYQEIERLRKIEKQHKIAVHIGLGGGKAIDACKCVAMGNKPIIICPTIASTDAPTSHVSVVYTPDGVVESVEFIRQNPSVVLIDTAVIAKAPVRFLVSGMGDALATYFEARSCKKSQSGVLAGGVNQPKATSTIAGESLSYACYQTLLRDGLAAKQACEKKTITPALENIIEANTLLSGLGFECGGLAAAHAIHDGLTAIHETHGKWHGEKVAFGVLTHLVLENTASTEINEVLNFCLSIGLPVCLEDLGIMNMTKDMLYQVSTATCHAKSFIHNMPFKVTPKMVAEAIQKADAIGRAAKAKYKVK